ncbi:MAG TPA: hypothetical protein VFD82_05600 [Planctomycetota bacterium]|nr:hypothetical protein [Planctomycetota bacterium]
MTRSLAICCALVLSCCTASAPEVRLAGVPEHLSGDSFPGAKELLQGFDALASDTAWRAGDEVLYGLRLRSGAQARHWMLHLRVAEPLAIAREGDEVAAGGLLPPLEWSIRINGEPREFRSRRCRVVATVTDEAGRSLGRSEPLLPRDLLDRGFSKACALVQRRLAERPDAARGAAFYESMDVRPLADATVCTIALLQVVQEDAVLAPLLWEVVERPSFWSVVSNLGARVVLRPRFHAATEAPSPLDCDTGDVSCVPMTLVINDVPALHADLLVATTAPPFALCGGVLLITARHPSADVEFSCLLLGARRGPVVGAEGPVAPRSRQQSQH